MSDARSQAGADYPLPPQALRFMGEDDAKFQSIGDLCIRMLRQAMPLDAITGILDIGCGYGRLAHALLRDGGFSGAYYGVDILPRQIAWCQQALSPLGPYRFSHLDIHNARYNPSGRKRVQDLDFSDAPKVDVVTFYSVFTHLYEEDIRSYLRCAASVLRPQGKLLCTAFLQNDSSQAGEAAGRSRYPMPHRLNGHTRYHDQADPLYAIGYDEQAFLGLLAESGLRADQVVLGGWCGRAVTQDFDPFQDLVIAGLA